MDQPLYGSFFEYEPMIEKRTCKECGYTWETDHDNENYCPQCGKHLFYKYKKCIYCGKQL